VAAGADLVPVLTSTPFGAVGGQPVTHTVTVGGTGTGSLTAVQVTFTTTVDLDGVTATTSQGACLVVSPRRVVCDLGTVNLPATDPALPKVTVAGAVQRGTVPGTLVQNLASVTAEADADRSDNEVSNAYLVPGAAAPTPESSASGRPPARAGPGLGPALVGASVAAVLAVAGLYLLRRRRR
jgi:hypothetical protein